MRPPRRASALAAIFSQRRPSSTQPKRAAQRPKNREKNPGSSIWPESSVLLSAQSLILIGARRDPPVRLARPIALIGHENRPSSHRVHSFGQKRGRENRLAPIRPQYARTDRRELTPIPHLKSWPKVRRASPSPIDWRGKASHTDACRKGPKTHALVAHLSRSSAPLHRPTRIMAHARSLPQTTKVEVYGFGMGGLPALNRAAPDSQKVS